jgi:hypothetical protein
VLRKKTKRCPFQFFGFKLCPETKELSTLVNQIDDSASSRRKSINTSSSMADKLQEPQVPQCFTIV